MIVAQRILGTLAIRRQDYAIGQASLEASLALARQSPLPWWTAETLVSLGDAALEQGDLEQAIPSLAEGLAVTRDLDDRFGLAGALEASARLAVAQGAPREALRFAGAAATLRTMLGTPLPPARRARLERELTPARAALGAHAAAAAWAEGQVLPLQELIDRALALTAMAPVGIEP